MKTRKTFFYSSVELYCYRMFLRMGSGDLSNSLFWFTIDKTQKMGEGKEGSGDNSGVYQLAQPCVFPKAGPGLIFSA